MKIIELFNSLSISKKLSLLFILALALRFSSYFTHPYIHSDSVTYLSINYHDSIGDIQTGLELHRQLPPAILYFMRGFSNTGIDVELGYRVTGVIFYSLALFSLFYIARFFISENAALFATFCYVCHPKAVDYSHAVLRETIAIPFMLFGLSFLLMSIEKKKYNIAAASGLCIAFSYMARLEYGVAFILGLIVFVLFILIKKNIFTIDRKRYFLSLGILLSSMISLLVIVNIEMKSYDSYWDPFAYRKVKGFVMRTFSE